jgi:hypothetical protein
VFAIVFRERMAVRGTVRIVLELREDDGVPVSLILFHGDVGDRGGEKDGLQEGTQEGDRHRPEQEYEQQSHT